MKRNSVLRFIIHHRSLDKFFSRFKWFNDLVIKRAKEVIWDISDPQENTVIHITTRRPVEFIEEGYEDRAEMHPICPSCKEYLDNRKWNFCPHCGIPIEW